MSVTILVRNCRVVKGASKAVLACLSTYADRNGTNAFPSQATLAADTGYCVRTVARSLKLLEDIGLIRRTGGRRSRRGRAVIVWRIVLAALSKHDMGADRPVKQLQKKQARQGKKMGEADAAAILAHQYGWDTLVRWSKPAYDAAIQRIIRRASPQACS